MNASLSIARAKAENGEIEEFFLELQRLPYPVMGDVAMPAEQNVVGPEDGSRTDEALESWREHTGILNEFVVAGESKVRALLDFARSVVCRVARGMVAAGLVPNHPKALVVVNCLSDLLFVVARNADGKNTLSKEYDSGELVSSLK